MDEQKHDNELDNELDSEESRFAPDITDDDAGDDLSLPDMVNGEADTPDPLDALDDLAAEADALAQELDMLALDVGMMPLDNVSLTPDEVDDEPESDEDDGADAMFRKPPDDVLEEDDSVEDDEVFEPESDYEPRDDLYESFDPVGVDPLGTSDLDVDSALDSLTGLGAIVEEHEKVERRQADEVERLSDIQGNPMAMPRSLTLNRGGLVSLLPGVAFIGIGAWLTFAYTTDAAPPTATVGAIVVGLFALMLFTSWIASSRWNRGSLFISLWGILTAVLVVVALNQIGLGGVLPAVLAGLGGAFLLSGFMARPVSMTVILPGLMFLVAAGIALVVAMGVIPTVVMNIAAAAWIGVAVVIGILLLLPVIRRIRG